MNRLPVVVVATLLSVAVAPAFAAAASSARIGPISITLYDLAPLDGIAPAIRFNDSGAARETIAHAYVSQTLAADYQGSEDFGAQPWAGVAAAANSSLAQASAALSGSSAPVASGATLAAQGRAGGVLSALPDDFAQYRAGAAAPYYNAGFTVSANTLVVFSALAFVEAAASYGADDAFEDYAEASVHLSVEGPGGSGSGSQSDEDSRRIGGYADRDNPTWRDQGEGELSVSFINLTTDELTGYALFAADVSGYSYASPVPEPGSAALLLGGLAAVGLMARRRRG